ncbi:MAG: sulfatase-like hydrolase/transferase, partial [Planctomycetota bacterium]
MHHVQRLFIGTAAALTVGLAAADPRPNVVMIVTDDLGYGDVGFNGGSTPTPALDALAASGVNLTAGYVTHPYCGPSRAGLITGRWQQRFGFVINPPFAPTRHDIGLPPDEKTLPTYLQEAGYQTGMVGKWHLGVAEPFHPLNRGFDFYMGFRTGGHHYFPETYPDPDTTWHLDTPWYHNRLPLQRNRESLTNLEGYLTDVLSDEAAAFIERAADGDAPFFLYLAYNAPHTPIEAKAEDVARFAHVEDEKERVYAAMVYSLSQGVGRVMDALDDAGVRDNTIVFFLSDNGGKYPWSSNAPLRGHKGDAFEGGIRVPFLMSWPARIEPDRSYDGTVLSLDMMATVLAAAGVEADHKPLDGKDLMPYLDGNREGS